MGPRSLRIGPADDHELLAVERFGLAPQAAVSPRIGSVNRLRDHALEAELAGVLQDEFAVAGVMAIELKAGLVCYQRLEQRPALNQRQTRDVPAADMQEIESVIDEMHAALAVARRLGTGKAGQSGVVDATKFPIDIGGLHVDVRQRGEDTRIFGAPVEAGPGEQLHAAAIDPCRHAIAVQLYFMHPSWPRRRLLDWLRKLGRDELGKGNASVRPIGLQGLGGRTLNDARHAGNSTRVGHPPGSKTRAAFGPPFSFVGFLSTPYRGN